MLRRVKGAVVERLGINRITRTADTTRDHLQAVSERLHVTSFDLQQAVDRLDRLTATHHELAQRVARAEADLAERAAALEAWQAVAWTSTVTAETPPPVPAPLLSVVMATRNRADLLPTAIASVLAQRHHHWELVIVDDASSDGTAELLATYDDPRIVVARGAGTGAAAARNLGVRMSTGMAVAFLDDDNTMDPGWLHAVAVELTRRPDTPALYGAQLREPEAADGETRPSLLFVPEIDETRVLATNPIDLGALAVRRDHPELWFDETLRRCIDWELVVRLQRHGGLAALPVWASYYRTTVPNRITSVVAHEVVDDFVGRLRDPADPLGRAGRPQPAS